MSAPSVKKGSKVNLVLANGERAEAKIISDGADDAGRVDLSVAKHPKHGDFTITRAPHDPTGAKADSWHLPNKAPAQEAAATTCETPADPDQEK